MPSQPAIEDMIDLTASVERYFSDSARLISATLPQLAGPTVNSARLIVAVLMQGGKILCCGNGGGAALADYFASLMLNRFERERPALPALALSANSALLTGIPASFDFDELFARQVKGLGQTQDLLLAICSGEDSENIHAAILSAREQKMGIITLSSGQDSRLSGLLRSDDIEIAVPECSQARIQELHLLVIHALCELIDQQLMGG